MVRKSDGEPLVRDYLRHLFTLGSSNVVKIAFLLIILNCDAYTGHFRPSILVRYLTCLIASSVGIRGAVRPKVPALQSQFKRIAGAQPASHGSTNTNPNEVSLFTIRLITKDLPVRTGLLAG
jgi:hypothetical protein